MRVCSDAYQCRTGGSPRDCSFLQNDTVYAEYEVLVDGAFGPYLACNPNTSSPEVPHAFHCAVHGGPPEWSGCRWSDPQQSCPRLLRTVGKMPVDYACSAREASGGGRSPIWSVWRCNISKIFADAIDHNRSENEQAWFSTPSGGECVGSVRPGDGFDCCTWRSRLVKTVPSAAVDDAIAQLVVDHAGPEGRFEDCQGDRGSLCWSSAFFDTITGNNSQVAPLTPAVLSATWLRAFGSVNSTLRQVKAR